jgi:hypothetical protein
LHEMISGLRSRGYRWEIGEKAGGLLPVRITYLIGRPQNLTADAAD